MLALVLGGCSSTVVGRDNLVNRGPVIVSKSNPYLASNMLLKKETELSPTLKGFLKIKGTPEALEVEKEILEPYYMYLYYPSQKEKYVVEEINGDWVIRGPEVLAKGVLSNMPLELRAAKKEEPVPEAEIEESADIEIETPSKPVAPSPAKKEVLAIADGVEGDIIHLVKYKGETLRLISGWYTGNADNASRIARINGFKDANALILDQKIRIPRYLVTKDTPLMKEDVDFYLKR